MRAGALTRSTTGHDEREPLFVEEGSFQTDSQAESQRKGLASRPCSVSQALQCQLVVAAVQVSFVIGSVYLKASFKRVQGLHFHPTIFAFTREAIAGPILCTIAYACTRELPKRQDMTGMFGLGVCLFLNQLFYILGIDMAGVMIATCIQPSIPVITVCLSVILGLEAGSAAKILGIITAVTGSMCMVVGGVLKGHSNPTAIGSNIMLGNMCLLANTVAMAMYYILAKQLVTKYSPVCVAAWAYIVAASLMGSTALLTVSRDEWLVPPAMYGALLYWIFVASVGGYAALTWACSRLPASQVAAFQCLQPFFGLVLASVFLNERPTVWDLGGFGILAGLFVVVSEASGQEAKSREKPSGKVGMQHSVIHRSSTKLDKL